MITIRLFGGAKKAVGKPALDLDRPSATVTEILEYLKGIASDQGLLRPDNLIVAVNGVDSSALQGMQTLAMRGDTVTIVTVVHGGTDHIIDDSHVSAIGVRKIAGDAGVLIDRLRAEHKGGSIQAINAGAVYGTEHLLGVLRVTIEAEKRKIMLANKRETELLMRLACTGQISDAVKRAGLKSDAPGCFVAISQDREVLHRFYENIKGEFEVDDSVLEPSARKKAALAGILGLKTKFSDSEFLEYLLERAAIVAK
jgi:tRNA threonylcarbamoyladenosine modification (KEOPS) complex Cgi121 subunit/molybdopterin converting factor small subunit